MNEDGKECITSLYSAGDYLGYLALLENSAYEDTAEVLEDAEVAMIPKDEFTDAVYNDMAIATKFIRLVAQDVKERRTFATAGLRFITQTRCKSIAGYSWEI